MKASLFVEIGDLRTHAEFDHVDNMDDLLSKITTALPEIQKYIDHLKSQSANEIRPG